MPPNTTLFLLGLAVGTSLLIIGLLLGYWFGHRAAPPSEVVDRQQFLTFLTSLSNWTSEFSGDVSRYQSELDSLSRRVEADEPTPKEEILTLLSQIMQANQQLQDRLDNAEQRLESQTSQISNYLTEARTDGLTGLANRRAFDQATDELFTKWRNQNQPFSLGLIDIDHFKSINDTYGHQAGDAVLQTLGYTLQSEFRDSFCVARYGGEEFAVLAQIHADEMAEMLDHLRDHISRVEIQHEDLIINVTLSGGASEIQADEKIGKLVRRADEALYAAKLGGRNRVYVHDGMMCQLVTKIEESSATAEQLREASVASTIEALEDDPRETQNAADRMRQRLQDIVEEESARLPHG